MKAKLLLFMLVLSIFIGCSKDDDGLSNLNVLGCWKMTERTDRGIWKNASEFYLQGIFLLRPDGQFFNTTDMWSNVKHLGTYKAYGDSIVFYEYKKSDKPTYYCKVINIENGVATFHFSLMTNDSFYDAKCVRTTDNIDLDFLKYVEDNPEVHYPKE